MNTYKNIIEQVNYGLFLLLAFLLPYPQVALRWVVVIWFVTWVLEGRWLHRPVSLRNNPGLIPILLFGLWFGYKVVSYFWCRDTGAWAWQMERYITFAAVVPIGIWGINSRYNWQQVGRALILGCTSAVFVYLATMTLLYLHPSLVATWQISPEWDYTITAPYKFFSENLSHIKHRLFLCSTEMAGIIVAFHVLRERKALLIFSVLVMLSSIPLTSSRQSIITGAALIAIAMVYALPRPYRLRYGLGILLVGAVLGCGLLMLHPRMRDFNFQAITQMRDISYTHDVRFNIWGVALQTPHDYLAHGLGAGQSTDYMLSKYEQFHMDFYIQKHYHPHNQYLEELIEGGIPGLILFLLAWLFIPFCVRGKKRKMAIYFVTLFGINMLTDCMFGKFCGIALWAVSIIYLLLPPSRTE